MVVQNEIVFLDSEYFGLAVLCPVVPLQKEKNHKLTVHRNAGNNYQTYLSCILTPEKEERRSRVLALHWRFVLAVCLEA